MRRRSARPVSLLLLILAVGCAGGTVPAPSRARVSVTEVLGGDAAGFARAERPREFVFPRDHAEHSEFRNEWWYFTGHLTDGDGDAFGYQLTFFRTALLSEEPQRQSAWAARNLYMAHLALSDVASEEFRVAERFARGAMGLAGSTADPLAVWLEGWRMDAVPEVLGMAPGRLPELRLSAAEDDFAIDLRLAPSKPPVAHGDNRADLRNVDIDRVTPDLIANDLRDVLCLDRHQLILS